MIRKQNDWKMAQTNNECNSKDKINTKYIYFYTKEIIK